MKKNVGGIDRIFRITAGIVLLLIAIFVVKSTLWSAVLVIIGAAWLLTGVISHCPVYLPFGMSTKKTKEKSA